MTDGQLIITSGGFPKNHVAAVKADGSGKTAWENGVKVYVPSMLHHRGYLYAVDRANSGLFVLELTGEARAIASF